MPTALQHCALRAGLSLLAQASSAGRAAPSVPHQGRQPALRGQDLAPDLCSSVRQPPLNGWSPCISS